MTETTEQLLKTEEIFASWMSQRGISKPGRKFDKCFCPEKKSDISRMRRIRKQIMNQNYGW